MLRSSREGRKQAARYHAFPSQHPSFSSRFSLNKGKGKATTSGFHQQSTLRLSHGGSGSSNRSSLLRHTAASALDSDTESEDSFPSTTLGGLDNSIDDYTNSLTKSTFSRETTDAETVGVLIQTDDSTIKVMEEHNTVLLRHSNNERKTPSRETTEDHSQSQYNSSPLSSPPTSHPDEDEDTLDHLKSWQESVESSFDNDALHETDNLREIPEGGGVWESRSAGRKPRPNYKRLEPRLVEGESLIDHRSPRTRVKSQKMVEAEETLALSPNSKKTLQGLAIHQRGQISSPVLDARVVEEHSGRRRRGGEERYPAERGEGMELYVKRPRISIRKMDTMEKESVESAEPVRRGRGRPRGSTKEKRLERLRKVREASNRVATVLKKVSTPQVSIDLTSSTDSWIEKRPQRLTKSDQVSSVKQDPLPMKSRASLSIVPQPKRTERKQEVESISASIDASSSLNVIVSDVAEKTTKPQKALWKRKSFLTSGLYSDDYKHEASEQKPLHRFRKDVPDSLARGTSRTRKASQMSVLPLPIEYGSYLLGQERDFRLPFPITQEIEEIRGRLEAKKKPPPYKQIPQNRYVSRSKLPGEILICQCPSDGDCGDSCVNRQTEYLCHPKHCPCGERCTNIYFGKRRAIKTEVQWYGARGFGLKTMEPITKGGFIDEYRGEVVDFNEAVRRIRDHYKDTGNYYFLMYDAPAGEMLDGGLKGNITRFANHSCDPNCKVQKWLICGTDEARSGEFQVALFAERDIEAGEELTYDYGWSAFAAKAVSNDSSSTAPEVCHCGAVNCSGFLGVKKSAAAAAASTSAAKLIKQAKRKSKARGLLKKDRTKSKVEMVLSSAPAQPSSSTSTLPVPSTPTTKRSPIKLNRRGLMEDVLASFGSPCSSLTSLSSLSDLDNTESERSADSIYERRFSRSKKKVESKKEPWNFDQEVVQRKRKWDQVEATAETTSSSSRGDSKARISGGSQKAVQPVEVEKKSSNKDEAIAAQGASVVVVPPPKKRLTVKDRVIRVLVPIEKLAEPPLILEGKRERRLSTKAAEQETLTQRKTNKRRSPVENGSVFKLPAERLLAGIPRNDFTATKEFKKPYHGLRNANGNAFNINDYPDGTTFYTRLGKKFNFVEYRKDAIHRQGSKPYLFTKQEREQYLERIAATIA